MSRVYNFSAGPAVLPEPVLKEVAAEMNINETGLHDRFKRGFVNINDLIKLLDSLDMDLIIRDRRYNR